MSVPGCTGRDRQGQPWREGWPSTGQEWCGVAPACAGSCSLRQERGLQVPGQERGAAAPALVRRGDSSSSLGQERGLLVPGSRGEQQPLPQEGRGAASPPWSGKGSSIPCPR